MKKVASLVVKAEVPATAFCQSMPTGGRAVGAPYVSTRGRGVSVPGAVPAYLPMDPAEIGVDERDVAKLRGFSAAECVVGGGECCGTGVLSADLARMGFQLWGGYLGWTGVCGYGTLRLGDFEQSAPWKAVA